MSKSHPLGVGLARKTEILNPPMKLLLLWSTVLVIAVQAGSEEVFQVYVTQNDVVFYSDNITNFQDLESLDNYDAAIKWISFKTSLSDFGLGLSGFSIELNYGNDGGFLDHTESFGYLAFIPLFFKFRDVDGDQKYEREIDSIISVYSTADIEQPQSFSEYDGEDKSTTYYTITFSKDGHFQATCQLRDQMQNAEIITDAFSDPMQKKKDKGEPSRMKCDIRILNVEITKQNEGIAIVFFFVSDSLSISAEGVSELEGGVVLGNSKVGSSSAAFTWDQTIYLIKDDLGPLEEAVGHVPIRTTSKDSKFKEVYATLLAANEVEEGEKIDEIKINEQIRKLDVKALEAQITKDANLSQGFETKFVTAVFSFMPPVGSSDFLWDPSIGVLLSGSADGNGGTGNGKEDENEGEGRLFEQFGTMEVIWIIAWCLFIVVGVICLVVIVAYLTSPRFRKVIQGKKKPSKAIRDARNSRRSLQMSDTASMAE